MTPTTPSPTRRRGVLLLQPQFWIGFAITGFFIFMMFQLWRRESAQQVGVRRLGISPDLLTVTWVNYDQFMWVYRGEERVGIYSLQVRRADNNRDYILSSRSRLTLNVLNQVVPIKMDVLVNMNRLFELEELQGHVDFAGQELALSAFTDGLLLYFHARGPELLVPNGSSHARVELPEPVMLADAIRPVVAQSDRLKVGAHWSAVATDPISGKFQVPVSVDVRAIETLEIDGVATELFRVSETSGEARTTSWYDRYGRVMKSDLGNGMTMIRANEQEVYAQYSELSKRLEYPKLEREGIRAEAAKQPMGAGEHLLNWSPKI